MKLITRLSFMALTFLLFSGGKLSAQCQASFVYFSGANGAVTFTSTSTPANSITTQYYWTFGNGNTFTATGSPIATTNYTANGTYTVSLFFMTVPSCSNVANVVITVTNVTNPNGCNLQAGMSNYLTGNPGQMGFNNNSTGTLSSTTYTWNYGDGSTSNTINGLHTYTANGNYTVTLTANNNTSVNCVNVAAIPVTINNVCNLNASMSFTMNPNGLVNFRSTSTGTLASYQYKWVFGDGGIGSGVNTSHTYTNGTYNAILVVKNNSVTPTCVDSAFQVIVVSNNTCALSAGFTYSQAPGGVVNFFNTSAGTNSNTQYSWNFGNGTISNSAGNPNTTYLNGGVHIAKLTIIDGSSPTCSSAVTQTINVTTVSCTANPNFTLVYGGQQGFWNAVPAYPWNVVAANWSWGDATNSYSLFTSHTYSTTGNYQICLTVTVSCGATASACTTYSIYRSSGAAIYQVNVVSPELKNVDNSNTTGLAVSADNELKASVYPNPVNGQAALMVSGLKAETSRIRIMDATGREIINVSHQNQNGSLVEVIDLQNHPAGVYFITVQSGPDVVTRKIVLSK